MSASSINPEHEKRLMAQMFSPEIADDPEAFVMWAFPWGVAGTPLENQTGPKKWQARWLRRIKNQIVAQKNAIARGEKPQVLSVAVASGRGIGKSALLSWLALWMMSTKIGSTTVIAANSEQQLKSRTFGEIGKWVTMAINSHWWEKQTMTLRPAAWFEEACKKQLKIDTAYYYAQGQLWDEANPDAFAGLHNQLGFMLLFDEASGIPSNIWAVSDGFFTDISVYRFWFCFSNPRRNSGAFFECFHKNRGFWETQHLDSRTVEGGDPKVYEKIIAQYGEDSDEARVEVYGEFPNQAEDQFISSSLVKEAQTRVVEYDNGAALILGVDVARGKDWCVARLRHGRDARSVPAIRWKSEDSNVTVNKIAATIDKYKPDATCIDGGGLGGPIIDALRARGYKIHEVQFGAASESPRWVNKGTEIWADLRTWLETGAIDDLQDLYDDLVGRGQEYGRGKGMSERIMVESKEDMRARGLHSPDDGDALAVTFATKVARRDNTGRAPRRVDTRASTDYDVLHYGM